MRIFVTGATGFVGRAAVELLLQRGHTLVAWVRSIERARALLGDQVTLAGDQGPRSLGRALEGIEGVVHLAGEPVLGRRWSDRHRRELVHSRVEGTYALVEAMRASASPPRVLVSASAVGYYGDRGDELLTEESSPGRDFLAGLCRDWEAAALQAEHLGTRVVLLRIGLVLGRAGGALARMLPLFRAGLGGPVGSGEQHQSWIHLDDLTGLIALALEDSRLRGPVNATSPAPVTSRELAGALGRALGRPARLRVPALALRLGIGEGASVLLSSQRVEPRRLLELGVPLRYPELDPALAQILDDSPPRG